MTQAGPTFSQIKAQVAAIRRKLPRARTMAIRTKGRWTGESVRADGDETYIISQCDSPLAMRLALRDGRNDATRVLVTEMDDRQIGDDILVRLRPRKVVPLDNWQIVRSLFQARQVDPRLTRLPWMAETLMELSPTLFKPVPSGFLDAEHVWSMLLDAWVGLSTKSLDLQGLLAWSADQEAGARFRELPAALREAATAWVAELAGPAAESVLGCVARHEQPDALPVGLVLQVVTHPEAVTALTTARVRLQERYLGRETPADTIVSAWVSAAIAAVRQGLSDDREKDQLLARADAILDDIGAAEYAWLSDTLPRGFTLRMVEFGRRLEQLLDAAGRSTTDTRQANDALFAANLRIRAHDAQDASPRRMRRLDMALRLVRWLEQTPVAPVPQSLAEAAEHHLREGGYLDWARLTLRRGDEVRELSKAYARLFDRVTERVEQSSAVFAELLRDATVAGAADERIVPVEDMLDRIVVPIAEQTPVLLIVMDGMSVAVFRELMEGASGNGWSLLAEDDVGLRPGLATIPSVTEASRTSLLTGCLQAGAQATERSQFPGHAGLLGLCRAGSPPVIFHKASLQEAEDASLAAELRDEIGSARRRVVAVVVNAVDDHLAKGEQLDTRWTFDEITVLSALLHEARAAGRTVILTSDHGHVLDCHAVGRAFEGSQRWRPAEGEPEQGELCIRGSRVVLPESRELIAPWTEKLRYGGKQNGYHGGLTPQEMIVPIGVLTPGDAALSGWSESPVDTPTWWDPSVPLVDERPAPEFRRPESRKRRDTLFDMEEEEAAATGAATVLSGSEAAADGTPGESQVPAWVTALLQSPVYAEQKQFAGRAVPGDDVLERLLTAIETRGGTIRSAALARDIQLPPTRLRGLLALAQRVFNIDGYGVLTRDEASDTIKLDRTLLIKQFDLQ